jgi:phosphatidylinositol-3-phosphatase
VTRLLLVLLLIVAGPCSAAAASPPGAPVRHVFLIVLENQSYGVTFGPSSPAPYLAGVLAHQGALLTQYHAIGHNSLGNYIAMVSGQAPNEETQSDCAVYSDFVLYGPSLDPQGQARGIGCVYPRLVPTIVDQLEAAGFTWRGYMEDMGKDPARESRTCGHSALGRPDRLLEATPLDGYAAKHNPFVYFHSIVDDPARCDAHVVSLEELPHDLAKLATTPNYVFLTPNLCHDGHDDPCIGGAPGGLRAADEFLRHWVPLITRSEAFRRDGLLIITFDESDAKGPEAAQACCGERPLPGARYLPGLVGPGGGRIGAVLLGPGIKAGAVSSVPYNHYSLLRSIEQLFGLAPLGFAADPALTTFGDDIFR